MNRGKKEERRKQRQASDLLKALQLKPPSQRRSHFNKIEFKWWRQKLHEREGGREFLALVIVVQEKWHNIVYREPKASRLNSSVEHCSNEPFASKKKANPHKLNKVSFNEAWLMILKIPICLLRDRASYCILSYGQ